MVTGAVRTHQERLQAIGGSVSALKIKGAFKMAAVRAIVVSVLFLCSPGICQPPFEKQVHAKISKRSFAADNKACKEGFELSDDKRSCLACREGYYRSWCMSACEKCTEPINYYEQLMRKCTSTRNSIVVCKDDAYAVAGLCTSSHAVKFDCNGVIDPPATYRDPMIVTKETTQVAATAPARTGGRMTEVPRRLQTFSAGLESLLPSEMKQPTTLGEYDQKENAKDFPYTFLVVYISTVVVMVGTMAVLPRMSYMVEIHSAD